MRDDLVKLKRLQDTVIGLELELDMTEKEILVLSSDIGYMEIARDTLIENLKILKKEKIIAMVSQYKKSINDLNYITNKIRKFKKKLFELEQHYDKNLRHYNIYKKDYLEHKKLVENQKVILYFDKSKKRASGNEE